MIAIVCKITIRTHTVQCWCHSPCLCVSSANVHFLQECFEVDHIVACRCEDNGKEYWVQWVGYMLIRLGRKPGIWRMPKSWLTTLRRETKTMQRWSCNYSLTSKDTQWTHTIQEFQFWACASISYIDEKFDQSEMSLVLHLADELHACARSWKVPRIMFLECSWNRPLTTHLWAGSLVL